MIKKYDYSQKYKEKTHVKFRRCRFCKEIKSVEELETKTCCNTCYTIIFDKKRCKKCSLRRPTKYFKKSKLYKDGYESKCLDCKPKQKCDKEAQRKRYETYKKRKNGELEPKKVNNSINSISYRKKTKKRQEKIKKILKENEEYKEKYWIAKIENQEKRQYFLEKGTLNKNSKEIKSLKKNVKNIGYDYQLDHIIPIIHEKVCGLNVHWNMQILTKEENVFKSNRFDGTYDNDSWRDDFKNRKK